MSGDHTKLIVSETALIKYLEMLISYDGYYFIFFTYTHSEFHRREW